jgi:hypothetical protein
VSTVQGTAMGVASLPKIVSDLVAVRCRALRWGPKSEAISSLPPVTILTLQRTIFDCRSSMSDIKRYLSQLQETLPSVPPISPESLKALHKAQDYKGMVKLIKGAMNIEDITFRVFWVPEGAAAHQKAPAWVKLPEHPNEIPFYGTAEFKKTSLKMFFRKTFLADSTYDQVAIMIAHELSHVVLDSIRHPLKRVEKAVDLTAMLLGFRHLYVSGAHKTEQTGDRIKTHSIGYLSLAEVQLANQLIEGSHKKAKVSATPEQGRKLDKLSKSDLLGILLISVIVAFALGWGLGRHFLLR